MIKIYEINRKIYFDTYGIFPTKEKVNCFKFYNKKPEDPRMDFCKTSKLCLEGYVKKKLCS